MTPTVAAPLAMGCLLDITFDNNLFYMLPVIWNSSLKCVCKMHVCVALEMSDIYTVSRKNCKFAFVRTSHQISTNFDSV